MYVKVFWGLQEIFSIINHIYHPFWAYSRSKYTGSHIIGPMTKQGGYFDVNTNSELTFGKNPISQPPRAPRPSKKIQEIADMLIGTSK